MPILYPSWTSKLPWKETELKRKLIGRQLRWILCCRPIATILPSWSTAYRCIYSWIFGVTAPPLQFQQEAVEMYVRFRERGHSDQNIRWAKTRARAHDWSELIGCNSKLSANAPPLNAPVRMITKFGSQWKQVREILTRHWHILTNTPLLQYIVIPCPLMVAKRARNLQDSLVHSEFQKDPHHQLVDRTIY